MRKNVAYLKQSLMTVHSNLWDIGAFHGAILLNQPWCTSKKDQAYLDDVLE